MTTSREIDSRRRRFSDADDETFLIRWRGREEGPYSGTLLEQKLTTNAIGLLHEILHNGQWVTIKDFLSEKDAQAHAQQVAQETEAQRQREDHERDTRLREERLEEEKLRELKRQNDLLERQSQFDNSVNYSPPDGRRVQSFTAPAKSRVAYILLGLFLGGLGIHNFYAGFNGKGVTQLLLTLLGLLLIFPFIVVFIWVIVEIITVNADSNGVPFQ